MATLAALLLLVAASNAAALSAKAVEYHSFVATPLSPHAYTAPAADADEDVFGGSLAVAEEAQQPPPRRPCTSAWSTGTPSR
ncbi:unnamed protein product [Miscanthus lutarioriparius]|uniref:Uncharacterized protein n=1 Tax=Miscanthus lutarioriparius TaxID=422564 RepID=A0A811NVN8_9POAL|nr:unnamed protein product [Miscanthus lutarioriparius]